MGGRLANRDWYGRDVATPHLVPLTVADPVTARILAAHLGAEGVVWEIRGNVGSPYPVGPVELLVDRDSLELARQLLAEAELPPDTDPLADAELPPDTDPSADAEPPGDRQLAADHDPLADCEPAVPSEPSVQGDLLGEAELPGEFDVAADESTSEGRPADTEPSHKPSVQPSPARSWLAAGVVVALLVIVIARVVTAAL